MVMPAPRMNPSGMIEVSSVARMEGKLLLFGYGQDESIVNPGDLLIVSTNYLNENMRNQEIEFKLRIRGRDMWLFADAAKTALELFEDNKDWLLRPMNVPGVNQSKSEIRSADQSAAIQGFYQRQAKG